jgi:hypothetical protein
LGGLFGFSYFRAAARLFLPDAFLGSAQWAFHPIGITAATLHKPVNNPNHYIHSNN